MNDNSFIFNQINSKCYFCSLLITHRTYETPYCNKCCSLFLPILKIAWLFDPKDIINCKNPVIEHTNCIIYTIDLYNSRKFNLIFKCKNNSQIKIIETYQIYDIIKHVPLLIEKYSKFNLLK